MSHHPDDTIAAIATASGGAARGIVRVSGADALAVAATCFRANDERPLDCVRQATAVNGQILIAVDAEAVRPLTCQLFIWPSNRSYTREPVVEFHTLGSPPILAALLATACRAGARVAEPGEFTLRAFLAGRLDLTQAEAVLGVIDAQQATELQAALQQLAGGLARPLHRLRDDLLQLLAELEAGLDFVDEDIEFISRAELKQRLDAADAALADVAEQVAARMASSSVNKVAIIGPPNVGKSSLFNALVSRYGGMKCAMRSVAQPAIVSPTRGTTRDYLSAIVELDGVSCELIDTAGMDSESESDTIESASQSFAKEQQSRATIRAWCIEASCAHKTLDFRHFATESLGVGKQDIVVLTKSDLHNDVNALAQLSPPAVPIIVTSSRTGEGLNELGSVLRAQLTAEASAATGQVVTTTADRCRESIHMAKSTIGRALELMNRGGREELIAAEIRTALDELGKVVGAVYTDDLLDRIFKTFCIGK